MPTILLNELDVWTTPIVGFLSLKPQCKRFLIVFRQNKRYTLNLYLTIPRLTVFFTACLMVVLNFKLPSLYILQDR